MGLNLPLCGIALLIVTLFLNLKVPQEDFWTKIRRMDWIGNGIIIVATVITILALTWAGITYPWGSYQILVPLVLGVVLTGVFFGYEAKFAAEPVVPLQLLSNRTSLFGYVVVLLHQIVAMAVVCKHLELPQP